MPVARLCPPAGPQSFEVTGVLQGEPVSLPFALVKLEPPVLKILGQARPRLSTAFANRTPPRAFRFGIGDTVSVTIFEAAAGGLFIPAEAGVRPGNFVTIPNQAVDNNGNISVPYAGNIPARGRTPVEIQQAIVDALRSRAIEPQAVVSLVDQRASLISVLGDVRAAGRFPAAASGERILDAITRAGGPSAQGYDTWVTLEREGHRASVPFGALVYEPSNNIFVIPNDTIYLYSEPQTFVAFGAAGGGAHREDRDITNSMRGGFRWQRPSESMAASTMDRRIRAMSSFIAVKRARSPNGSGSIARNSRDRSFQSFTT